MSIIDSILADIDAKIEGRSNWHVEIIAKSAADIVPKEGSYLWDAGSYTAAKAIKEYLVTTGMTDGTLDKIEGSFIYVVKRKQHKAH